MASVGRRPRDSGAGPGAQHRVHDGEQFLARGSGRRLHGHAKADALDIAGEGSGTEFYLININFAAIPDEALRQYCYSIPTGLQLSDESVDKLREAAKSLLKNNAEFIRLLGDLESGTDAP